MKEKIGALLEAVRARTPLVHSITNYVTVNDCANALLAIGGSPIMADAIEEAADIASIASALALNMGTLNSRTVDSMLAAGKRANERGIPVVFDPVGAGACAYRNEAIGRILKEVHVSVLRGNLSEVAFVAGRAVSTKGVDVSEADERHDSVEIARTVAKSLGCIAAVTGAVDVISDGERVIKIYNGHREMSRVTGTGCMTTAIIGAFAGASGDMLTAATAGVASMGIAGELAYARSGAMGTGSFRVSIIDMLSKLDSATVREVARIEEV